MNCISRFLHRWILIPVFALALSQKSSAQFVLRGKPVDTNYVNTTPSQWSARLYLVSKYNRFSIFDRSEEETEKLYFNPNGKIAIGIGAYLQALSLDLGINVSSKKENDSLDVSKSLDLLSALYAKQHVFDLSFQLYTGFFTEPGENLVSTGETFRGDIRTFNFGLNYNYLFNYRKFSFAAPFIGTQIQKKSAGSPLAGVYFTYYDLRANEGIIPKDLLYAFEESVNISEANIFSAGLTAGYAYTLVLPLRFFITLSANPAIAFNVGDLKTDEYFAIGDPLTVSFKFLSRNAIGYGGSRLYGFASWITDANYVTIGNQNRLNYNLGKIKVLVGYRFKSVKLKKGMPIIVY